MQYTYFMHILVCHACKYAYIGMTYMQLNAIHVCYACTSMSCMYVRIYLYDMHDAECNTRI